MQSNGQASQVDESGSEEVGEGLVTSGILEEANSDCVKKEVMRKLFFVSQNTLQLARS
jgi:hypothetical protein